ncbi:K+-transporting ATPase, F subunit [Hydrogenophaga sp. T4]|nr:K+-transporting ATPase, F subunit [Hydrogenophaga sp. T4]
MNGLTLLAALLAGGLLIYLVAVLLRPEDFS